MYEIAISINALCFDKKRNSFKMNHQKVRNLIDGYETIRPFTKNEKKCIKYIV